MTNRKLNKQEKHLINKQLDELKIEFKSQEFLHDYATLMLNIGLEVNYKKQRKEFESKKIVCYQNIEEIEKAIKILNAQLKDGVEMIEEKKEGK